MVRQPAVVPSAALAILREMEANSESEREWLERTRRLLRSGAELAGPGVGAVAGMVGVRRACLVDFSLVLRPNECCCGSAPSLSSAVLVRARRYEWRGLSTCFVGRQ